MLQKLARWLFSSLLDALVDGGQPPPRWVRQHAFRGAATYRCTGCGSVARYPGPDGPRVLRLDCDTCAGDG